jgi:adenine-specific DNA-methyltransferase
VSELEVPDRPDIDDVSAVPTPNHGEVFTQQWVVELILDLAGYTPDRDLADLLAVEPACGGGAFLILTPSVVTAVRNRNDVVHRG